MCPDLAADLYPKFIQQLTTSPRFLAGENVHCDTAATTASSNVRPPSERLSSETRNGCPVCETSTRTTTTSLGKRFTASPDSWGSTRVATRGDSSTSAGSKRRPAGGVGATIRSGSATCGSTTGDAANCWTICPGTGCRAIGRGASNLRAVFAGVRVLAFAGGRAGAEVFGCATATACGCEDRTSRSFGGAETAAAGTVGAGRCSATAAF